MWAVRSAKAGKQKDQSRGIDWKTATQKIGNRHPGQDKFEYRLRLKFEVRRMASFVAAGHKRMTEENKERFNEAMEELTENLQKIQADPTFVPELTVTQSFWCTEDVLDFSSSVMEGADNYYLCRNEICIHFTPNTNWCIEVKVLEAFRVVTSVSGEGPDGRVYADLEMALRFFGDMLAELKVPVGSTVSGDAPPGTVKMIVMEDGGHYRCGVCGQKYEPWQTKAHNILANKIIVTTPGDDPDLAREVGMRVGEVAYQFVLWVDTPAQITERRCQEIQLDLAKETRGMDEVTFKAHVLAKIEASSGRTYFAKTTMLPATVRWMDDINGAKGYNDKQRWRYQHLKGGFWGAKAPAFVKTGPGKTVVHDNDEALVMWAYARQLCGLAKKQPGA